MINWFERQILKRLKKKTLTYQEVSELKQQLELSKRFQSIRPLYRSKTGIEIGSNRDPLTGEYLPVIIDLEELLGTVEIVGSTGSGKSVFATILFQLLIDAYSNKMSLIIIDPHGDFAVLAYKICKSLELRSDNATLRQWIQERLFYFDATNPIVKFGLDPFKGGPDSDRLIMEFVHHLSRTYGECFSQKQFDAAFQLCKLLRDNHMTLMEWQYFQTEADFIEQLLSNCQQQETRQAIRSLMADKREFKTILRTLGYKIRLLMTGKHIKNHFGTKTTFPWHTIVNKPSILICNLDDRELSNHETTLLGSLIFSQIKLHALKRKANFPLITIIDELPRFIHGGLEKELESVINQFRKKATFMYSMHQNYSQISQELSNNLTNGARMTFVFNLPDATSADFISKSIYTKPIGHKPDSLFWSSRYELSNYIRSLPPRTAIIKYKGRFPGYFEVREFIPPDEAIFIDSKGQSTLKEWMIQDMKKHGALTLKQIKDEVKHRRKKTLPQPTETAPEIPEEPDVFE